MYLNVISNNIVNWCMVVWYVQNIHAARVQWDCLREQEISLYKSDQWIINPIHYVHERNEVIGTDRYTTPSIMMTWNWPCLNSLRPWPWPSSSWSYGCHACRCWKGQERGRGTATVENTDWSASTADAVFAMLEVTVKLHSETEHSKTKLLWYNDPCPKLYIPQ